jgi:hypothetical protein
MKSEEFRQQYVRARVAIAKMPENPRRCSLSADFIRTPRITLAIRTLSAHREGKI